MGLTERIQAAAGERKAALVLKHCSYVNVFTNAIETGDIAIEDGIIAGIGEYEGEEEREMSKRVVCPGFIDGHIHIESSMLSPKEFARAVLPHGTTAVVTDPHEIANVAGTDGIDYMLAASEGLPLDVFFMLPSCVPATALDESGACLTAKELEPYYAKERVTGLAELMNSYGTVRAEREILEKLSGARTNKRVVDGHAPGLSGNALNAYICAGVESDHECMTMQEAYEKLKRGQWIMIREGTAAKNLTALLPLFCPPYYERCLLVTDDRHPGDLIKDGHMDYIIRKAVSLGADPFYAIRMASLHAAQYFGLKNRGAIAPGYLADFAVVDDLEHFQVLEVYKAGVATAQNGVLLEALTEPEIPAQKQEKVCHSFHVKPFTAKDFAMEQKGQFKRVIGLTCGELYTKELIVPYQGTGKDCAPGVEPERDIVKLAVAERHHNTGHIGIGYLQGYGLKRGAVASSIAHDSHNLIVAGTNDADMAAAANAVRESGGGIAVAKNGRVLGALPLPFAGLMCNESAGYVAERLEELKRLARELGVKEGIDPFMTLAFVSLPVIPELRLLTTGLVEVAKQRLTEVIF